MKKAYIAYAAVICIVFGYASMNGWTVTDSFTTGKWGPKGHTQYHK
jgi:hypothetical protein